MLENELYGFLDYLKVERGLSPNTIEAYRLDLGKRLIPLLRQRGKLHSGQVTTDDIRAYLGFLAAEKHNSETARARKLASAKSFFNYLMDTEVLSLNPAARIRGPKLPDTQPLSLDEKECIHLLRAVLNRANRRIRDRDLSIILLLLHTGMRASELSRLKLSDVDLEKGEAKVTRKGGRNQCLYLNEEVRTALRHYLAGCPRDGNSLLFNGTRRPELGRKSIYEIVRRCLKTAGIDKGKRGPHLLRHTL